MLQKSFSLGLLSILVISIKAQSVQEYFVDPSVTLVEKWEGWGTSLAWWADVLGGMNEDVIDTVTKSFFDQDKLNLNIVRYVIGGTTPVSDEEQYPCGPYRDGGASETYKDGPDVPYDWTRDARQRKILAVAKELGVNIFEAFSNSPPQWMTISGCSKGNPGGFLLHNNLAKENATAFADYATEVIKYFHENWNITFETYDPFNEPYGVGGIGGWFGRQSEQEGCNLERSVMAEVVRSIHEELSKKNMTYVSITAADETHINTAVETHKYFRDEGLSEMISKINVHGYWELAGNRRDLLSIMSTQDVQRLWMDEMGWAATPVENMTQGIFIAERIILDIRKMLPSAWVYWQAMEDIGFWGLLGVPYKEIATAQDVQYNSGYFAMMQFSKYIKQGYKIIHINDDNAIAALDEASKTLIIVMLNSGLTPISKVYDLRLFSTLGSIATTRTSPSEQNSVIASNVTTLDLEENILRTQANPESITTITISNAVIASSAQINLLVNGDFESDNPAEISSWVVQPNIENGDSGINSTFPWRGEQSGFFHLNLKDKVKKKLSQVVTITGEGNQTSYQLYLTAWWYSTDKDATIIVEVEDSKVVEMSLSSVDEYQLYGVTFRTKKGNKVKVSFASSDGISYFDNVQLHLVAVSEEKTEDNSGSSSLVPQLILLVAILMVNCLMQKLVE